MMQQPPRPLYLAIMFSLLLTATGCTFLRETIGIGIQKPRVQLAEIQVGKVSLAAMELLVSIRVDNPNDFELRFAKLDYSMTAGELTLAAGKFADKIVIPATATAFVKLPLTIDANNVMKLAERMLNNPDDATILLKATSDFDSPLGTVEVSFEESRPIQKLLGK